MKLSFNLGEDVYIDDYMEEHRKILNGNRQDDFIRIKAKENAFLSYIVTEYHANKTFKKAKSEASEHLNMVYSAIWNYREIEKVDYQKIEILIKEEYPNLMPYIDDFALIVLLARNVSLESIF